MRISITDTEKIFGPWTPALGGVFRRTYVLDCETTKLDDARPWLTPAYVLGAAYDGQRGYFITRNHLEAFLAAHEGIRVVMHNAAFDLAAIHLVAPDFDVYRWVDRALVEDTWIHHRLYSLATDGHTAHGKGQATLERCAKLYLGIELSKDVVDSRGEPVRLSYGRWLNRPLEEIEPVYLEYLAKDAIATYRVYRRLRKLIWRCLSESTDAWGYVSPEWLKEQVRRWGLLTHHIQLRASIVLKAITAAGLSLDLRRRAELVEQVEAVAAEKRSVLHAHGYLPGGKGTGKALQAILRRLERLHPGQEFRRTPTGRYATSLEAMEALAEIEPFIEALLSYKAVEKLRSSFLDKMSKRVLHPSFDVVKVTGRTSSFGDLNAQNLPKDDRIRQLFTPPDGHVWINADYSAIEMVTLAQAHLTQFGLRSELAEILNAGKDPHRMVAALATGKPEGEVTKEERQKCKPINFGKPGGMGHESLKRYAKASYGVELTDAEVEGLSDAWFSLFPEMREFLADDHDLGEEVAGVFGLTPASYLEQTGSDKFTAHPANAGRERRPHPALGWMLLKVLKAAAPETRTGRPYSDEELDYFWSRVAARPGLVPSKHRDAVSRRQPSPELHRGVIALVGRGPVFTATGRLRANATFAARHNNIFQGLASDGAKLGLWRLWRDGYSICNFIHDEVLVAVPADSDLGRHARRIRRHMIAGMREVVPDVRVEVEYVAATAWSKSAERLNDRAGRLVAWSPPGVPALPEKPPLAAPLQRRPRREKRRLPT